MREKTQLVMVGFSRNTLSFRPCTALHTSTVLQ